MVLLVVPLCARHCGDVDGVGGSSGRGSGRSGGGGGGGGSTRPPGLGPRGREQQQPRRRGPTAGCGSSALGPQRPLLVAVGLVAAGSLAAKEPRGDSGSLARGSSHLFWKKIFR